MSFKERLEERARIQREEHSTTMSTFMSGARAALELAAEEIRRDAEFGQFTGMSPRAALAACEIAKTLRALASEIGGA